MRAKLNALIVAGSFLVLVGCASVPPKAQGPLSVTNEELRGLLNLPDEIYDLGMKETQYNPCDLGIGPLKTGRCGPEFYTTISMQMVCRKTTGTVSETSTEHPLYDSNLKWRVNKLKGSIQLDEDGFGIIVIRSTYSIRRSKIRLISGNDFLYMNARDLKKVLVPGNWCK